MGINGTSDSKRISFRHNLLGTMFGKETLSHLKEKKVIETPGQKYRPNCDKKKKVGMSE